jgi:hypothetical protein
VRAAGLLAIGLVGCGDVRPPAEEARASLDVPQLRGRGDQLWWAPVPGADRYELDLGDRTIAVEAERWSAGGLPRGRWRVRARACDGGACSPWSRARRVDVARVAGDLDGDGYADVIAGAPLADVGAGRDRGGVVVVYGGPSPRTQRLDEPAGHEDAELGAAVAIVGDVDGDGRDDVVVGAPGTDAGRGRAYLYLGGAGGLRGPVLSLVDPSGRPGDALGAAVSGAGDVDGDGLDDVAIGAPAADGEGPGEIDRGKVLVWRGSKAGLAGPRVLLPGAPRPYDGFGAALAAGDLDGDGFTEVIVGASAIDRAGSVVGVDRGAVHVFRGGRDGVEPTPVARLEAEAPADHDRFGHAISAAGDLDGDGYADLAVGAPSRDGAALDDGAVYVFAGGPQGVARRGRAVVGGVPGAYRRLGTAVAIAGDVDGDGLDDLVAGTSEATGGGVAVILRGGHLDEAPLEILDGGLAGPSSFGESVAGAGDVDGDGRADLVVGAATADGTGAVLVFRDVTARPPPPPVRIDGDLEPTHLGRAVAGR